MGFNYVGAATTSAHRHSAAASEGGSLDSTTLINGVPILTQIIIYG